MCCVHHKVIVLKSLAAGRVRFSAVLLWAKQALFVRSLNAAQWLVANVDSARHVWLSLPTSSMDVMVSLGPYRKCYYLFEMKDIFNIIL